MALTKVTNDLQDALAAAQPTITSVGTLTNFTSTGIDDNATSTAITIDASENVGVGVTPAAFNAASTAVQLPGGHFYDRTISETYIGNNSYHDSVDVTRAVNTGLASNIGFYSGNTVFQSAASVAAGALSTMVTNMTIDSSGKVKIASATTATPQLTIGGTAGGGSRGIELLDDNGARYNFLIAAQQNITNALEITPSTAAGNTTYSNPALVIDYSGNVTMPSQAAFNVKPASLQTNIAVTTQVDVGFGTEVFDVGANFASNTFTAPVTGKYQLNLMLRLEAIDTAAAYYQIRINTSNRIYLITVDFGGLSADPDYSSEGFSVLADMDASDTANVQVYQAAGGTAQTDIHPDSYFAGYLAC